MRNIWDARVRQGKGLVTKPKKLASIGLKKLIERALWAQGLRTKQENGKKRYPFQAIHCFRKWFKTRCEIAGMKPINIEKLMSHSIGISNSYYKPTENEILEDYLKVVDLLVIDKEETLEKELKKYAHKSTVENYAIRGKLQEKDEELKSLREKYETDMKTFRKEMEYKFQEILDKIDMGKI